MTERELLELAAKAAGIEVWTDVDGNLYTTMQDLLETPWNPLVDDGDALRLSSSLRMGIEHNLPCDDDLWVVVNSDTCKDLAWEEFESETDRVAATRRAIVRAAEIGKSMK